MSDHRSRCSIIIPDVLWNQCLIAHTRYFVLPPFFTPLAVRGTFSACPQEGYYIFREMAPTSAEAADDEKNDEPRPLKGPNQWPSEELLPG